MRTNTYRYDGEELDLFKTATNWRRYWAGKIRPFIGEYVVEVGAGLGSVTRSLCDGSQKRWLCLEPDQKMAGQLTNLRAAGVLPGSCEVQCAILRELPPSERFDTILYIDVLEHIEDDRGEVAAAGLRLRPGGRIAVLSPAHQWLFSRFDAAIGHLRRYTITSLSHLTPSGFRVEHATYLDSFGLLASAANRLVLRSSMPSERQLRFWDDRLVNYRLGKSVLLIWKKEGE
jgi:SAM-dependent methyltransferase